MRKLRRGTALITAVLGALAVPAAAQANTVTISGSMEGAIKIANRDHVSGGYSFSIGGGHAALNVQLANASIVFSGNCSNGGTDTLTVPLSAGPYSVAAGDNSWLPSGDEASDTSFLGSVVANVCRGTGTLDASKGATFTGDLESDVTTDQVAIRFHYRDPNAKGKGNYDCTAANYAASVCGASWSGTAHLYPSTPPPPSCTSNCTPPPPGCTSNCTPPPPGCTSNCTPPPPGCTSNCTPPPPSCTTGSTNASCTPPTTTTPPTTPVKAVSVTHKAHKTKKHKKQAKTISRPPKRSSGFTG
jgi:hypothetical protein